MFQLIGLHVCHRQFLLIQDPQTKTVSPVQSQSGAVTGSFSTFLFWLDCFGAHAVFNLVFRHWFGDWPHLAISDWGQPGGGPRASDERYAGSWQHTCQSITPPSSWHYQWAEPQRAQEDILCQCIILFLINDLKLDSCNRVRWLPTSMLPPTSMRHVHSN